LKANSDYSMTMESSIVASDVLALRAKFVNREQGADIRMGGAAANAPAIAHLARDLAEYPGTVLVVTNPVDVLTRLFTEASGCPRVYGIGSNLDSSRYRGAVARLLDVPPASVRGHVIGEHGPRAVVCASTTVDGHRVRIPLDAVRAELQARPARITSQIGRTRCGPAGAVVSTLRKALGLVDGTEELSNLHAGVWQGLPLHFTAGQPLACLPSLDPDDARQWDESAAKLRAAYEQVAATLTTPSTLEMHQ
jgi:L-lactate dehydrogenase